MAIVNKNIDNGTPFDWGKASSDYARFRDIYPQKFYKKYAETRGKYSDPIHGMAAIGR